MGIHVHPILHRHSDTLHGVTEVPHRHSDTLPGVTEVPPACSNEERLFRMMHWCSKLKLKQDIMHLSPGKLRQVVKNMYADDKHKVLFCSIPKSG